LAEAVELIAAYDFIENFRFLPFFESENALSDPCMFVLNGPLRGYIYHHLHDGPSRVLASAISSFARTFKTLGSSRVDLERATFDYPRSLSEKDKKAVQKIRAEVGDSDTLLQELASSMSLKKKTSQTATRAAEDTEYEQFLNRCEILLTKAGMRVVRDDQHGLLVGPNNLKFAWQMLQRRQKRKDFEKHIVRFIRSVLARRG